MDDPFSLDDLPKPKLHKTASKYSKTKAGAPDPPAARVPIPAPVPVPGLDDDDPFATPAPSAFVPSAKPTGYVVNSIY
jgi:hypothetical protein